MAITITDQSFIGEFAGKYWRPNLFKANTVEQGVVNLLDNIKAPSINIGTMDFVGGLQPRNAQPSGSDAYGTWTINKKMLTPQNAMFYTEFNPRDLEAHWESVNLSEYLIQRQLPNTFESYAMSYMTQKVFGQQMEQAYWMSAKNYSVITDKTDSRYYMQFTNGFMQQLVTAGDTLVDPSPSTITASNIVAKMETLISLLVAAKPGLVVMLDRVKFLMNPYTAQLFRQAMSLLTFKGIQPMAGMPRNYAEYQVVICNGMPNDTILFGEFTSDFDSALHIGYNSTGDESQIQLMKTKNADETYFVKVLLKFDQQIKYSNEIAMHTLLTSSSFVVS